MTPAIQLASKGRALRAMQQVLANLAITTRALADANLEELDTQADKLLDDAARLYKELDRI